MGSHRSPEREQARRKLYSLLALYVLIAQYDPSCPSVSKDEVVGSVIRCPIANGMFSIFTAYMEYRTSN